MSQNQILFNINEAHHQFYWNSWIVSPLCPSTLPLTWAVCTKVSFVSGLCKISITTCHPKGKWMQQNGASTYFYMGQWGGFHGCFMNFFALWRGSEKAHNSLTYDLSRRSKSPSQKKILTSKNPTNPKAGSRPRKSQKTQSQHAGPQ